MNLILLDAVRPSNQQPTAAVVRHMMIHAFQNILPVYMTVLL